jgi:hypothetical protein
MPGTSVELKVRISPEHKDVVIPAEGLGMSLTQGVFGFLHDQVATHTKKIFLERCTR